MIKRIATLVGLLFFITLCSFAQQPEPGKEPLFQVKVFGVVLDSLTREGEPYATIRIVPVAQPEKVTKLDVTGPDGKFGIECKVATGNYTIQISSVGKTPVIRSFAVSPTQHRIDLGVLYSAESNKELQGVEVVAQKPLVKVDVDKIQYNMEDDPDAKTNSTLEMLRKVPLVTVDGEDNIKVNGSSNFKIHVNGKPNNMMSSNPKDVLSSMPAHTIKHIEVITDPGAKYDAEGVGGILNIVTQGGGFEGYTASFTAFGNNRGLGGGIWATIKQGKFTLTANYNYNYNANSTSQSDTYREDFQSERQKYLLGHTSTRSKGSFNYGNLEASYEFDTLRLLSVAFGLYGGGNNGRGYGFTRMWDASYQHLAYGYESNRLNDGDWYSIRGSVDYQRTARTNKQRMLTLSYKVNTMPQNSKSNLYYTDVVDSVEMDVVGMLMLNNNRNSSKTNTAEQTFQIDYTTPLGKIQTLEAGVKYILRNNNSDNKVFEADGVSEDYQYVNDRSSHYKHINDILGVYAGYMLRYKDFTFKPGLRYEYTSQHVRYLGGAIGPDADFRNSYQDFIPSVSLGLKLNDSQNIRGGYNMRIWRPGIWSLNPYFNDLDPLAISQGNPDLNSEKSHVVNLSYSMFTQKVNLNLSLRHSFTNNSIERVSHLVGEGGEWFDNHTHFAPEGAMYTTSYNIGKSRDTGLSIYFNWNATDKLKLYVNGGGSYVDIKSPAQGLRNSGWTGNAFGGIQYQLPWKLNASLNGGGTSRNVTLQGMSNGYYYYSLSLNRSFFDDRFTVNINGSGLFEEYISFKTTTEGSNFRTREVYLHPNRRFGIKLSYRIGSLKASVRKANRTIDNDDVKGNGGASEAN